MSRDDRNGNGAAPSPGFRARPGSYLDARLKAQRLAFGPILFQAARFLRDSGLLARIDDAGDAGIDTEELVAATELSDYAVRAAVEAGYAAELVEPVAADRWKITLTGHMFLDDDLTRVNVDFVHDVCYEGAFRMEESLREERPAGLEVFGDWPTVYAALAELPDRVRRSWFAFDHFYSDSAFPKALPHVLRHEPRRLLDIGGNTGKFAVMACKADPELRVGICDLPGQLADARIAAEEAGLIERIGFIPVNLLDHEQRFPPGTDAVWLSQLLVCFPPDDVVSILARAREALRDGGSVFILDNYWDRQRFEISTFCLLAGSLYFTNIANGTSRMYRSTEMKRFVDSAGLTVVEELDDMGFSGTLWRCVPA